MTFYLLHAFHQHELMNFFQNIVHAITEPADFGQNTFVSITLTNFTSNTGRGRGSDVEFPTGDSFVKAENGGSRINLLGVEFVENTNALVRMYSVQSSHTIPYRRSALIHYSFTLRQTLEPTLVVSLTFATHASIETTTL